MQEYLDDYVTARGARAFLSGNARSYIAANVFEFRIREAGIPLQVRFLKIRTSVHIDLEADRYIPCRIFFDALVELMRFNMLFTGYFLALDGIQYIGEGGKAKGELEASAEVSLQRFVDLYRSPPDLLSGDAIMLYYPEGEEHSGYFDDFVRARSRMAEGYELFLAASSLMSAPQRMKFAMQAESFETLFELLTERGMLTARADDLRGALAVLIAMYGTAVFQKESRRHKIALAEKMTDTRNRFRRLSGGGESVFSEREAALYREKLQLLYRHILMQAIGFDYGRYRGKLHEMVRELDNREGIVGGVLHVLAADDAGGGR